MDQNKSDRVVLNKDKETWIIAEGTVCNTGCIHLRTLCKQQKYTDLKSGLKPLHPNHKVGQVNILLDFLGGYNKQQLEELEKVCLNIIWKELDQTMSKNGKFNKTAK